MKTELFNAIAFPFGWTLLHSLWQGALVYVAIRFINWLLPSQQPTSRYFQSTLGLGAILLTSVITFLSLFNGFSTTASSLPVHTWALTTVTVDSITFLSVASLWINQHVPAILLIWTLGTALFAIRLLLSWLYTSRLQRNVISIGSFWEQRIQELAVELGIRRPVHLAQSKAVNSPLLLGILKPVILLPVGMLTGLTPSQIETILLHELAHIRRNDSLVNLLQSITEVFYFFNPFVWLISSEIRVEREECCDEVVVKRMNPLAYAQALHQLEEARMQNMALAAKGNKNQLLIRIKRFMETKERREANAGRIIAVACVALTLIMASWISVQAYLPERNDNLTLDTIESDTIPKTTETEKSATYSKKSVITVDKQGNKKEEITEDFTGDENLKPLVEVIPDLGVENFAWNSIPVDTFFMNFQKDPFEFTIDTVPDNFHWNEGDWNSFGDQFAKEFKERFGNFYKENNVEFDKLMKDLDHQLKDQNEALREQMKMSAERMKSLNFQNDAQAMQLEAEMLRKQAEQMARLQPPMNEAMALQAEKLRAMAKELNGKMESFNKELTEALIRDGYLDKDSQAKTINWTDTGIEVNGKKIKDADRKKYEALHKKYFEHSNSSGKNE